MSLSTSINLDGYQGNVNVTGALTMSSTGSFGATGAAGNVTTLGTDNLVLNTNSGTNSGNITLTQGVNGNITATTNGSGIFVITAAGGATLSAQSTADNAITRKDYVDTTAIAFSITFGY